MGERYLEDYQAGQKYGSKQLQVDASRIQSFAAECDPQAFHLDETAARSSLFRGLAASGWHTAAMTMRLLVEVSSGQLAASSARAWLRPRRPGDELRVESEILEVRPSKSGPNHGLVKLRTVTLNQNGDPVRVTVGNPLMPRRSAM
jgi:acyl dehydratase